MSPNRYVVEIFSWQAASTLLLGDRIDSINGEAIEDEKSYSDLLAPIPVNAVVRVGVERQKATVSLDVKCDDADPYTSLDRKILQAIKNFDWKGCVAAVRDFTALVGYRNSYGQSAFIDCGFFSDDYSLSQQPQLVYEYWSALLNEAQWDPILWPTTRGQAMAALSEFERIGQARLAADLQRQIDGVDARIAASADSQHAAPAPRVRPGEGIAVASGTGFLVDASGGIVTSEHVIANGSQITAKCGKSPLVEAKVVAKNRSTDIAVLGTDLKGTSYLSLAKPRSLSVGQDIFTYGFPVSDLLGAEPKFTDGTVSALSGIGGEQAYFQMSVPVQPGNSGGPVVNAKGEVVGIVAAQAAIAPFLKNTGTLPQNVNWAVKAEYAALMFDAPPPQPPSATRQDAIKRVAQSLCLIEVR